MCVTCSNRLIRPGYWGAYYSSYQGDVIYTKQRRDINILTRTPFSFYPNRVLTNPTTLPALYKNSHQIN